MSSLKSHSHVVAGWDLNLGILAPRQHAIYSSLFYTVLEIAGSSDIRVVKARGAGDRGQNTMKTEMGVPSAHRSIQIRPPGKQQAPSGVSTTGPVSVGADWQGASSEAGSSLL